MDLTTADLEQALAVTTGETADSPAELTALVRKSQPSFAATLFSAWERDGEPLGGVVRAELDATRSRIDFYRVVAAKLTPETDGLIAVKGLEVASLYPAGLVRYMNDLDFVAQREAELWHAVTVLLADGWELDCATFLMAAGRLQPMVSLRKPHEDRFQLPYGIELASYFALGDLAGVPPMLDLPRGCQSLAVKNMLMLLNERHEQPFRAKDIVDAALLHAELDARERATLPALVSQCGLLPEYGELSRLVGLAGLAELPPAPGGRLSLAQARARRLARSGRRLVKPVPGTARELQRQMVMGTIGRAGTACWNALERRIGVPEALADGLLAFGLPLEGSVPPVAVATLRHDETATWIDTPAGRFLLTIGDEVAESAVDALSAEPVPR